MRRLVLLLSAAAILVIGTAPPAYAHGRGSDATNFASRITAAPDLPGVSWRVYGGDEMLGVSNHGSADLVVLGYYEEPYLRIGPEGVWENRRSPAAYLNQDRFGETSPPPEADPDAEPDWQQISEGSSHAWHDHRIHWMSPGMPPQLTDTTVQTLILPWEVEFLVDGEGHTLTGELWWVPGPSPWPLLAGALVLTLPALAGVRSAPDGERWTRLARPAAVVLGVVAALNLVGVIDDVAAVPLPLGTAVFAGAQTVLYSGLGLFAAVRGWRGDYGAFVALGFGAGLIALGQGLLVVDVLGSSQLATVFPSAPARLAVALSLVQVVPVGIVAYLGSRRLVPAPEEAGAAAGVAGA